MTRAAALGLVVLVLGLAGCEGQKQAIQDKLPPAQLQKEIQEDLPAARAQKAHGDTQAIAAAVKMYSVTFGTLPDSLEALTAPASVGGVTGGPFLRALPAPPPGWSPYRYEKRDDGSFIVTSAGEGATASAP